MGSQSPPPVTGYRGRLAPSPTGLLHVGHARTFWTAAQRARDMGGTLVLRMEDLDRERSRSTFADAAIEDLRWLGIRWQEGPDKGGPFAPYVQSKRRSLYIQAWRRLLHMGLLYPCRCSRKDPEAALAAPHESNGVEGTAKTDPEDDSPSIPAPAAAFRESCRSFPAPPRWNLNRPRASTGAFACPTARASNSWTVTWGRSASWQASTSAIS